MASQEIAASVLYPLKTKNVDQQEGARNREYHCHCKQCKPTKQCSQPQLGKSIIKLSQHLKIVVIEHAYNT